MPTGDIQMRSLEPPADALVLSNRHTGEMLALRRFVREGRLSLVLWGRLPPHSQGPPLHIHHQEKESGAVVAGTLSAIVDGRRVQLEAGQSASFPIGAVHRWWNDADDVLIFEGEVSPVVDLDRYLQAVFEVMNSGPADRPPLFYIAHVVWRHRHTQSVLFMPRPLQKVMLPIIVAVGTLLGRYRGNNWPGATARCSDAPMVSDPVRSR
jgi:mannose-6-phosphate isomerase-like protein (cupin superfamily)